MYSEFLHVFILHKIINEILFSILTQTKDF